LSFKKKKPVKRKSNFKKAKQENPIPEKHTGPMNYNVIEKAKNRINRAAKNTFKPTKDKNGMNIK
jgi:hypothetical protein